MCHARRLHQPTTRSPVTKQDPGLRASDAERDETVTRLRTHAATGRLDVDELEQRISAAYAAGTHGELAALERDLPAVLPSRPPRRAGLDPGWIAFAQVNALLVAIWAFTGAGYFWPAWVIGSWGLALLLERAPRVMRQR
jgi:hypothetical protein